MCRLPAGARVVIKLLRRLFFAYLVLLIVLAFFGKHLATQGPTPILGDSSTVLFYHNHSETFRNENGSITVYDGADADPPLATEATTTVLKCNIMQQIPYSFYTVTGYVGMVSWMTPPLSEDYMVDGTVTIYIWLSSNDVNVQGSGYAVAITDMDENENVVGDPFYKYFYNAGKVLSEQPTEYSLSVNINHVFPKNHKLAFEAIVGSTTQGWTANVYFDSPDRNSRAVLPGSIVVVPEFEKGVLTLLLSMTASAAFIVVRCKRRESAQRTLKVV
jgi:hypothetical protein